MLLLGLDTATPAVTVAIHDGGQPLAQLVTVDAHRHAELLAPAIAKVIADAAVIQRTIALVTCRAIVCAAELSRSGETGP